MVYIIVSEQYKKGLQQKIKLSFIISKDIMSQEAPTLKWGDIIRIHGVNRIKNKDSKTKGLIVSKGFTDPNIYYQKYDDFQQVNLYRESLFQILPRSNFDIHDQMMQPNLTPHQKQQLKSRAINQIVGLENCLHAKRGTQIRYGSQVIFRHAESQSYLRGILRAADIGQGAFKIQVTEHLSSQLIFKIKSHRSYEKQNDKIYYDDALQIYHPGADCYMNFVQTDKDEPIFLDLQPDVKQIYPWHPYYEFALSRPSIKKPVSSRIPIVNQNKSKCLWKFIQHCTYQEYNTKDKIKSHDIVYFQHTKENGLVSSTLAKPTKYYLKQKGQGFYYQCFWELIPKEVNELGPQQCDSFWVKNVVTGQLLTYNDFKIQIQSQNLQNSGQGQSSGLGNGGLINLICSEPNQNGQTLKLERGKLILIPQNVPLIVKQYEKKFQKVQFVAVPKMPKDIFKIFKVGEQTLLNLQYALSSHEPLVKLIQILSAGLVDQFHRAGGQSYEKDQKFDYKSFFLSLKEDYLVNIITILKMLIGKIFNTSYDEIVSSGNLPDQNMQKILVQTGIVQLVIQIINLLYEPFLQIQSQTQPSEDRAIRNKISQIFEYSYRLLQKVAVNNEENRTYISRWVDLFLKHSNYINQPYIQQTLVGILQNNPASIQATINRDKIKQLISSFFKQAKEVPADTFLTTKFLRLFSTFIVCQNRVILENQNIILNDFFKNSDNQQIFRVKIDNKPESQQQNDFLSKIKSKEVQIAFGKQQFTTILKFFRDWTSKWNYFIAYINLLADICLDRNNEAIKNVSALLSLQMVVTILFDPEMDKLNAQIKQANEQSIAKTGEAKFPVTNVHEPFIRIAHYLYINNDKFDPVKRIKKIRRWYRNDESEGPIIEDINKTKRAFQGQKEEQEKNYLKQILLYISQYLRKASQNPQNLSMLYTVLDLLKTTIELGLWDNINQFRQLIPLIVMRITKIDNDKLFEASQETKQRKTPIEYVNMNKQLLKMNKPQISKSIQCKIKATQIFRTMNQFEIDIRLRYIMNFFKGLYETTEDFNAYDIPIPDQITDGSTKLDSQRNVKAKQQFFKVNSRNILGEGVKKVSEDQQILLKTNVWYSKLKAMTPFNYEPKVDKISDRYLFQGGVLSENVDTKDSEQIKQAMNEHFQHIILALLELPIYHNYRLLNSSLRMLRSIFEQRKQLVDNFKSILICGKGNLQEVYLTLKFMRNKFQMLTNMNISKYNGNQDSSFSYALWKPYDSLVKFQDKRSGIIQDLFFLSRSLKDNISLKNIQSLMRVEQQAFDPTQVYSFFDERQKNNVLFQALNIAEGIYVPLMYYIKIMKRIKFNPQQAQRSIHYKLLRSIYQYLTLVCFNNLQAKQQMIQYIPHILPHLSQRVGAASFLYVISNNNKTLISDEDLVNKIIQASLQACNQFNLKNVFVNILSNFSKAQSAISKNYEKSQIFYALRGILLFNGQGHHRNQELLMNKLQDNKYRGLIYQQPIEFREKLLDNFQLSPQQSYVAAHFQMFASLVQSGNLINIGKLQNIHNYSYCLQSLKGTNRWQIRRALRTYVNRLYYVNKQKDVFLFEQFVRKQFDIINNQLNDIILLHKNKALTLDLTIKNGIRFKFAVSEIMVFIVQVLITLNQIFLKSEFKKVLSRQLTKQEKYAETSRPLHQKLIKLYKNLGCLNKLYPQTKPICSFLKEVSQQMREILYTLQTKYIQKKAEPEGGEMEKLEVDQIGGDTQKKLYIYDYSKSFFRNLTNMIRDIKAKKKLQQAKQNFRRRQKMGEEESEQQTKKRCLQNIFSVPNEKLKAVHAKRNRNGPAYLNPHLATTSSRTFKVLARQQLSQNDQNIQLNNQLSLVKRKIEDSPQFQKFRDEEHILFVNILSKLDLTSSKFYGDYWQQVSQNPMPVISMKQIISVIFNLMVKKPKQVKDEQKIFVVKLIRCYITEAIQQKQDYKLPVDKWDDEYCQQDNDQNGQPKNQFAKRQQLIQSCGGSAFIISILSQNLGNRIQLLNEVLLLGIAYLFNGNSVCQNSILNELKSDDKNLMLLNIKKLIKKIGDFLIEVRANKQNDKNRNFAYNIVDTFDYFSVQQHAILKHFGHNSNDKYEMQVEDYNEKAMCRLFRFLQLFCENNNTDMKKFLSVQINNDDSKKTNSVNFIEQACLLLRKFFKIMNSKVVNIPNYLLAFLSEITQLPCLQNQISLMKSTFFEDISYLATFFEEVKNRKIRGFDEVSNNQQQDNTLNDLLGIYEQGVGLILSNFQGNDSVIMSQFINKCHPRYLWIVMRNNIWALLKSQKQGNAEQQSKPPAQIEQSKGDINENRQMLQTFNKFDDIQIDKVISTEKKKNQIFGQKMAMILDILSIVKKLDDYSQSQQQSNKQEAQKAQGFRQSLKNIACEQYRHIEVFMAKFEELLLHISVSTFNGQQVTNQNLYFPKHPVFEYLSKQTKDYIMMEVKRDTRRDKLTDLTKFKQSIFSEIEWNYELNYYTIWGKECPITSNLCEKVRTYARNCSYIICALMMVLVFVDHDTQQMSSTFSFGNIVSEFIVRSLCFIQLVLTLLYCYLWGKMRTKLAMYKYMEDEPQDTRIYISPYEQAQQQKSEEGWVSVVYFLLKVMNKLRDGINSVTDYIGNSYLWVIIVQPILALSSTQAGFNSLALFVIGSLLGNFYGVEWFALHIFDYFVNIPLLSNIFKAILNNIRILVTFSLLAGAFILVFNILSFRTYTSVIYDEDLPQQACETIIDCVLQLYTSGAIGDDMDTFQPFRFGFDIVYVVFMELLFQNLVGGIMIDAFSQLKENDASRDQDKKGMCYICSMTRSDMQKNGETFPKHIQNHYLWNYVYYIYCLDKKPETNYTGIEYEIKTQLTNEDISWFPYMGQDDSEGQIKVVVEQLVKKVQQVKDQSQVLVEKSIAAIKEGTVALKKKE